MKNSRPKKKTHLRANTSVVAFGLLAVAFFFLGFLRVAASVPTERIFTASTQVLGDSDEDKSAEEQKKQEEKQQEVAKKEQERQSESKKKSISNDRVNIQSKEMEIETAGGVKVKTKIEDDGRKKIEIEQGKLKLKLETREQKMATSGAKEKEREIEREIEDEDLLHVATDSGRASLMRRSIKAQSDFPLSIDPTTNMLQVTTPKGTKAVTVLPDQAVENLLRQGFISTGSANLSPLASASAKIRLTEKNGKTVYEVQAKKKFRLFGVFNVETPTTVNVSTEDGQVISQEQSLLTEIVDFLSP